MTLVQATVDYDTAVQMADVGRNTLLRLAKSGEIASFMHGKKRRFVVSSIEDYCKRQVENALCEAQGKRMQQSGHPGYKPDTGHA